jgi:hypothetical protein
MPIATGYTVVPTLTLPIVVAPVDPIACGNVIMPLITLGGQILNSPITDSAGIAWVVQSLAGWDAADVRTTQTPRENDQGLFHETNYYGGRLIIAKGTFATATGNVAALMAARQQLHSAVNITGLALSPLVVTESPPKMCMVQLMSGCKDQAASPVSFNFEIHLLAPDPRKYDPAPTTVNIAANTTATVTNNGNMESRPLLTITGGPLTDFYLSNLTTGQNLLFLVSLAPTDIFVIDMDFKSAYLNGVSALADIASGPSQWWTLVPGANHIEFTTLGTGNLAVQYSSAWV